MDLPTLWNNLFAVLQSVPRSGLLIVTVLAVLAGALGSMILRPAPILGRLLRSGATLGLMAVLLLVVLQVSRMDPRFEIAIPELGLPEQVVEGGETRIPLAADGHFWVRANINGVTAPFMVDTGATLTTINTGLAEAAKLEPRRGGIPITMQTANGPIAAHVATLDEMSFGNVRASGLDVAIAPNIGNTNVLGMNMLSRLGSWRVEGQTMILQPAAQDSQTSD